MPTPQNLPTILENINPFRHPRWRAERAQQLANRKPTPGRCSRVFDDEYVKEYKRFLVAWNKGSDRSRWALFNKNPALVYAHSYSTQPDQEWRAILEARILAREPDILISSEMGVLPEAVDYYEKLFFHVRDRLNAKTWIIKTVLGPAFNQAAGEDDAITTRQRCSIYKLFAYHGGSLVLDIMLAGLQESPLPQSPDKARLWIDEAFASIIRSRSAIAARCMRVNKWNVMQLLELHQRFVLAEMIQAGAGGGTSADYEQHVSTFLEHVPLGVGDAAKVNTPPKLLEYEATAIEPRVDDQYELAQGRVPDALLAQREYSRPPTVELEQ